MVFKSGRIPAAQCGPRSLCSILIDTTLDGKNRAIYARDDGVKLLFAILICVTLSISSCCSAYAIILAYSSEILWFDKSMLVLLLCTESDLLS